MDGVVSGGGEASSLTFERPRWAAYLQSLTAVLVATLVCFPARETLAPTNVALAYTLVVTLVAYQLGRGPSVFASALGVALFDFFFVPPYHTLLVHDKQYLLTFLGLLTVSLVISDTTARARHDAESARQREEETASLFRLSGALGQALDEGQIASTVAEYATQQLKVPVHFVPVAGDGLCVPVVSVKSGESLGVLVAPAAPAPTATQLRLLETYARQAALALERTRLARAAQEAEVLKATERLQSALLNSISHDLRIPLVSITGALQQLHEEHVDREALVDNALGEAERLNRIVGNLLHMTRVESGVVRANLQPQELCEIVELTLQQMRYPERVHVSLPDDLPLVHVDFGLLQQVLANLLENALKFSPPDSPVDVGVDVGETANLWVRDRGPGVSEEEREVVFERFYRSRSDVSGSGLGLAICKGLLEAQNASIHVESADPGARFVVRLPWARAHG